MELRSTAVGAVSTPRALRDTNGTGLLAIQMEFDAGTTGTARILGRVSPDAPWREIKGATSSGFLETVARVPYLQLDVTALTGTGVSLWIAEA